MSINISVHGSPLAVKKQYGVKKTFDNFGKNHEFQKRRQIRLQQVREQSRQNSISLRKKVDAEKLKLYSEIEKQGAEDFHRLRAQKLINLQKQYDECCEEVGSARTETAVNLMKECRTQENKENERERALERGRVAEMKIQKEKKDAEQKIKETNERKRLVRNLENLRSSLVTNLQQKTLGQASRSAPNKQQPSVPDNSKSDKILNKHVTKSPMKPRQSTTLPKSKPVTVKEASKHADRQLVHDHDHDDLTNGRNLMKAYNDILQKNLNPDLFKTSIEELDALLLPPKYVTDNELSDNEENHQPRVVPTTTLSSQPSVTDRALSPIPKNQQTNECQTSICECPCKRIERGEKALNRVQVTKNYNKIVNELPVLKKVQQRNLKVVTRKPPVPHVKQPVLHMGPERRQEYEQRRQKRMEQAIEKTSAFNKDRNTIAKPPTAPVEPVRTEPIDQGSDLVQLIERVNQQKRQLLDDIVTLPADSNLEKVLEDLSNLVKEPETVPVQNKDTITSAQRLVRRKVKYKSIAAQTSLSSTTSSSISVEQEVRLSQQIGKSLEMPSIELRQYSDRSAQVSSDFDHRYHQESTLRHHKGLKIDSMTDLCEIIIRVRDDSRTHVDVDSTKQPRKIVRKKIYKHVSSVISSETSTSYLSPEIQRNKDDVFADASSSLNPKVKHYIQKLLQMPKKKIDQLSCSSIGTRTPSISSLNDEAVVSDKNPQTDDLSSENDDNKYKDLVDHCSNRIANLVKRIEQVRQEKSQIFAASNSSGNSTTDSRDQSTQYLEPPHLLPNPISLPVTTNNFNSQTFKKPPKPPASMRQPKNLNIEIEPHELSTIQEVDSILSKTGVSCAPVPESEPEPEESIHSASIENVLTSLGLNWVIPKLRKISKNISDKTIDDQLSSNSIDRLVDKILLSLSSTGTTSSDTLMADYNYRRSSMPNEDPDKQRTSTPVSHGHDNLDLDHRKFFADDGDISSIKTISNSNDTNK